MSIQWQQWSPSVFARAGAGRKPVLLSLVTAWSEECAAMDRTTYAHPEVLSLIEGGFVPVRVDADRRPDINDRYNLGGWPTTAFLTDNGEVLSGGTYLDAARMVEMLRHVADAWRDRAGEIRARSAAAREARTDVRSVQPQPDNPVEAFRVLLVDRFDRVHGGFGDAPKLPHPYALMFALSLARDGDAELAAIVEATLDRMTALWDVDRGGFHRYADDPDWGRPGAEKTLEDNAAMLHVLVEAALLFGDGASRERAAAVVRWVKGEMTSSHGGFFNAASARGTDSTIYVDRNAMMVGALLRAASLFDDVWLRNLALDAFESVIGPAYKPGDGVGHVAEPGRTADVRGLLTDQIHAAVALIWAHAASGRLPYSMLAAEVLQFAVRTMWDEGAGCFRDRADPDDPVVPFELNCHAACALNRLAVLTGEDAHRHRAQAILQSLAREWLQQDLFGAPYALAVREVFDERPPAGLELSPVDWRLGQAEG